MHMQRVTRSHFSRKAIFASLVASLFAAGCGAPEQSSSESKDIFSNDVKTRRRATADEMRWTVFMHGCTGSLLSNKYMLTANHCNPSAGARYTSGSNVAAGKGDDIEVVRVAENSSSLDYLIVEIKWLSGEPTPGQKYSPRVSTKASDLTIGRDGIGTRLITVGFPLDKRQDPTFAEGWAKQYSGDSLYYNIGSINGNSGGAVWRSTDHMLVSQTNFGNHAYGQSGWNNNNPEGAMDWNGGSATHRVYAQSAIMKEIFPGGNNKYADDNGNLTVRQR